VAQVNQAAAQQFSLDITNFAVAVQIDIELLLKAIAFQIFVDIVNATPVDTGRARASWTISAGLRRGPARKRHVAWFALPYHEQTVS